MIVGHAWMALNTSKCNHLTLLRFKGLTVNNGSTKEQWSRTKIVLPAGVTAENLTREDERLDEWTAVKQKSIWEARPRDRQLDQNSWKYEYISTSIRVYIYDTAVKNRVDAPSESNSTRVSSVGEPLSVNITTIAASIFAGVNYHVCGRTSVLLLKRHVSCQSAGFTPTHIAHRSTLPASKSLCRTAISDGPLFTISI